MLGHVDVCSMAGGTVVKTHVLRVLALVLAAALVLVVPLPVSLAPAAQADASVRQGAPCSIVGERVEKSRWVFICTSRAKARIWVRHRKPQTPHWQQVAEQIATRADDRRKRSPSLTVRLMRSPTVDPVVAQRVRNQVVSAYRSWNAVAQLSRRYPVIVIDGNSEQWYLDVSKRFPDDNCGPQWWSKVSSSPERSSGAVCWSAEHDWSYMVIFVGEAAENIHRALATHEVVHVAQAHLLGPRMMNTKECWLGEGMAELYTGALTFPRPQPGQEWSGTKAYRSLAISRLRVLSTPPQSLSDPEYWLDVIRRSEDRSTHLCWGFGIGYSLGYLVTEKLILDFGEGRFLNWLRRTGRTGDSAAAFAHVFGSTQDRWYERSAAPYVAREVPLVLR